MMEFFNKAQVVKLRCHLDKYLFADDDQETVRQSHNGTSRKAQWTVELIEAQPHIIRLKSCFGKYLTASEKPFLLGMTGEKVLQTFTILTSAKDVISIDWEPIREGIHVMLRAKSGGKFLRANSETPPWRNTVSHDVPYRTATQDWVLWEVETVGEEEESIKGYVSPASSFSSSKPEELGWCYNSEFYVNDHDKSNDNSNHNDGAPKINIKALSDSWDLFGEQISTAMELFEKAKVVRLKSHHDKYLLADEDEEGVLQDRNGSGNNARWVVEIVENANVLRFKSCYGKYLTASNMPFLFGMTGKKVLQTMPKRLDSSVEWEPIREGFQVRLKTRYGQYLRANGGLPPWRNSITHDIPHRTSHQDWVLWDVDIVKINPTSPNLMKIPQPILPPAGFSPTYSDFNSPSTSPTRIEIRSPPGTVSEGGGSHAFKSEGRIIYYHVAREEREVNGNDNKSFTFSGSVVKELKEKLKEETGIDEDIIVCSRNPLNGKLYPLRLHLPPNHSFMHVVVVPSSSKAAEAISETPHALN